MLLALLEGGGESKVGEFHVDFVGLLHVLDEHVLWLQVTVHHLGLMHVRKCKQDLIDYIDSNFLGQTFHLNDPIKQVATGTELHHNEKALGVLHEFEHACDVRMVGSFKHLKLVLHQFPVDFRLLEL